MNRAGDGGPDEAAAFIAETVADLALAGAAPRLDMLGHLLEDGAAGSRGTRPASQQAASCRDAATDSGRHLRAGRDIVQAERRWRRLAAGFGLSSVSPTPSSRPSCACSSSLRTGWPLSRSTSRVGEPAGRAGKLLAPLPQRHQDRKHPASLRRQHIFLIGAAVGGGRRRQDAVVDQRAQPHRQDVLGAGRGSSGIRRSGECPARRRG